MSLTNVKHHAKELEHLKDHFKDAKGLKGHLTSLKGLKGLKGGVSSIKNLVTSAITLLNGVLMIILGAIAMSMYNKRENSTDPPSDALLRGRLAGAVFLGIGVGIVLHSLASILMHYVGFFKKIFGYILILFIAITAAISLHNLDVVKNIANQDERDTKAFELQGMGYAIIGVVLGILFSIIFEDVLGKLIPDALDKARILGTITAVFVVAAASLDIFMYTQTGKNDKAGLAFAIVLLILGVVAMIGLPASFAAG